MTLDLTKVASQVGAMVIKIKSDGAECLEHLQCARNKLCDTNLNFEALKRKVELAHTPGWSAARLYEGLNLHIAAPVIPLEYSVVATDGSNIDVDRHKAAYCYLINIGTVSLHYGLHPSADLENDPRLYCEDQDLVIKDKDNPRQEQQVRGALLDAKRSVEESRKLAEAAEGLPPDSPALALMDGSLVMFGMQNYPDFVVRELVDDGLIPSLEKLKKLSETRPLAVASYISLPQSDDVINALRIAVCPQEKVDCDLYCAGGSAACDVLSGVNDRMLFGSVLEIGERSALFVNPSKIMEKYGHHSVFFFYLRAEDEIARVEIPAWVAHKPELVNLTHALVLDQCRRGQGYPVVLSEAHEKAVVTGADRELFWSLVEESLEQDKMPTYSSVKSRSKRTRWI